MDIAEKLKLARQEMLDVGLRDNSLLHVPSRRSSFLEAVDADAGALFETLIGANGKKKPLSFLPTLEQEEGEEKLDPLERGAEGGLDPDALAALAEEDVGQEDTAIDPSRVLQTQLPPDKLDAHLIRIESHAHALLQEQGIDVLYLALGFLEWFEDANSSTPRYAPLVLIPVELQRDSPGSRFRLVYTDAELGPNQNLEAKLKGDFRLELPRFGEEVGFSEYMDAVRAVIQDQPRWQVLPDKAVLGLFSYGKFQMYADLDPERWPEESNLLDSSQLQRLFQTGFQKDAALVDAIREHASLKAPETLHLVKDADSSQTEAILAAMEGSNLVIQGPPGTGKSQTITNLIGEALARGKRVLFVAQKMAALEVVKGRLDECHLGDAVLELHSHKSNNKAVLDSLRHVFEQRRPEAPNREARYRRLAEVRAYLDDYVADVGRPILNSGLNYVDCVGRMLALQKDECLRDLPLISFQWLQDWDAEALEEGRRAMRAAQDHLREYGPPADNPFRRSRRTSLSPNEDQMLVRRVASVREQLSQLTEDAVKLAQAMQVPEPTSFADIAVLHRAGKRALEAPHLQGIRVSTQEWQVRRDDVREAIACGQELSRLYDNLAGLFIDAAFEADLLPIRSGLAGRADKWWRLLSGPYRQARAALRGYMQDPRSGSPKLWLAWVDDLLAYQQRLKRLRELEPVCQSLFGAQWQSLRSDWTVLGHLAEWIIELYDDVGKGDLPQGIGEFLEGNPDLQAWSEPIDKLESQSTQVQAELRSLMSFLEQSADDAGDVTLEAWRKTLEGWQDTEQLYAITRFNQLEKQLVAAGLQGLVDALRDWRDVPEVLENWLLLSYYAGLVETAYNERPRIRQFDRLGHERLMREFRELDQAAFDYAQEKLVVDLHARLPSYHAPGEMDTLRREINKQRRHLPIRRLISEAGAVIQQIKPVFMMSPMSVATYLPQGRLHFDLVIFDEASQIPAPEALGAIARGSQAVVVGDSKQMPPTAFFSRDVEITDEEAEKSATADVESILDLMQAQGVPERMLRWHYRSRDDSLIAVSNDQFYDNNLLIFPSPGINPDARGLRLHHLPNAYYDRGRSRANYGEALAVAEAVMEHARTTPALSLGVVAFSTAQREAILLEVERLRREQPDNEAFFRRHEGSNEFFIKNLENVQGDERDVIYISIGYGFTSNRSFSRHFGPLNSPGGERRLNVLITRARLAMDVFANFKADDLAVTPNSPLGVRAFKAFLQYAESRKLPVRELSGREPDSQFEWEVMQTIERLGYAVEPQVGSQGFYIDLAVRDPEKPGRFVLAVECDGASYHSTAVARDRDRIRQTVLEGLGWIFHRIWSTEWFRNPRDETQRLQQAIAAAVRHAQAGDAAERAQGRSGLPFEPGSTTTSTTGGEPAGSGDSINEPGIDRGTAADDADSCHRAESGDELEDVVEEGIVSGPESAAMSPLANSGPVIRRSGDVSAEVSAPSPQAYRRAEEKTLYLSSAMMPFHEIPLEHLSRAALKVIQAEGPVHTAVLTSRLLAAADVGRAGTRIQGHIRSALKRLQSRGHIHINGNFAGLPEQFVTPPLRDWSSLPLAERKLEHVSDEELAHALYFTVKTAHSIAPDDAMSAALALLGFKRLTSQARARLRHVVDDLVSRSVLTQSSGRLQLGPEFPFGQ